MHLWLISSLTAVGSSWCITCVLYIFQNCESCTDSLSVCVIYTGAEHHGETVAEGAVRVCCGSLSVVSQLADRPGPQGAAHQRSPIHQPDRPSCWKAGRGASRPSLAQLTHETKTQCYRSASASLWCQCVLLIRETSKVTSSVGIICLDFHLMYVEVSADTALSRHCWEDYIWLSKCYFFCF